MIDWFVDPLQFQFMQRALITTSVGALVCGVLSCWLTLVGWSLLGDAVSHAVLPGVVLSYILGWPFAVGAFVFGCGAVALIGTVRRTSRVKEDAAIGVVFTGLFALGIVLVSVTPSQTDLSHILFGNVLGISESDLVQIGIVAAIALTVLFIKRRDLTLFAFDPVHAHTIGLHPRRLEMLLLGMLSLTVVVALQAVGIVLVVAMLITPGATAYLLTNRFEIMLLIAAGVALLSAVMGTYISFHADWSTGGTVVLTQTAVFTAAYLFAPRQGLLGKWIRSQRNRAQRLRST